MSEQLYELAKRIRYDATAIQAKVTDMLNLLNDLDLPDESMVRCGVCDVKLRGPVTLAEHLYKSHAGPVPEHWARIEALSVEEITA